MNDTHPEVVIRAEVNKTREARFITLSENACVWLQTYLETRHTPSTPYALVVPFTFNVLGKKREWNWQYVREGNTKWVPTGMRHAFASCYYAKFQSVGDLLKQLGHGSTEMLRKSYKRAVSKEEAERFLGHLPGETRRNENRCLSRCFVAQRAKLCRFPFFARRISPINPAFDFGRML